MSDISVPLDVPTKVSGSGRRFSSAKKIAGWLLLLVLVGGVVWALGVWVERQKTQQRLVSSPPPTPSPTPTPKPLASSGKTSFTVSSGKKSGPSFSRGLIDPYDPTQGSLQRTRIQVRDKQGVRGVMAKLVTDHRENVVPMRLVEGGVIDGSWEANWVVSDTYLYTYNLVFEASSSSGINKVEITLR